MSIDKKLLAEVAPYVGAWIETKQRRRSVKMRSVAPYVGAWIETKPHRYHLRWSQVAPYVGAWIETILIVVLIGRLRRTLRGCVD